MWHRITLALCICRKAIVMNFKGWSHEIGEACRKLICIDTKFKVFGIRFIFEFMFVFTLIFLKGCFAVCA
jgi:hypothetical protein